MPSPRPIAARPAPRQVTNPLTWLRDNLFADWQNGLATIFFLSVAAWGLPQLFDWAVFSAVLRPDLDACHATHGACWGVVAEKYRVILFGRYPYAQQWRPLAALLLILSLVSASTWRMRKIASRRWWLLPIWLAGLAGFVLLMRGGLFGLDVVATTLWGGLPLTVLLSVGGMSLAFPLAIVVALGRRSDLPGLRMLCTLYVELVRGVPLISVLFMASFMFPLFLPLGVKFDVLLRVLIGIGLFAGAYLAEVIRGGLQAVPKGQLEAAQALGLGYWTTQRLILLPQALRAVLPSIVNSFISTFKDCSLVTIVSLYELTGALSLALGGDANWRPFFLEGYLFVGFIYWLFCFGMSRYSRGVEHRLGVGVRHDI